MSDDVKGIVRFVVGYSKIPNKNGENPIEVEYKLKPLKLTFLQSLFGVDSNDPDPVHVDLAYCYELNEVRAKALQPYVIEGIIDLDKYNFYLECYADEENEKGA